MKSRILLVGMLALLSVRVDAQTVSPGKPPPAAAEAPVMLSEFTVSAQTDRGYNSANTVGATRVNIAVKNAPLSVVSLNPEFLRDVNPVTIEQAARYVSGVVAAGAPNSGQLTVRGQNTPGASFRDGVPEVNNARGALFSDPALIDRIEIVKGPAGTLYGSHNSGGIVNVISKMPSNKRQTTVRGTVAEDSIYRAEFDTQGPLAAPGWSYRFVAAYQDGKTPQGLVNNSSAFSPMVAYQARNGFRLLARYAYQHPEKGTNGYSWFTDQSGRISTFLPREKTIAELDQAREQRQHLFDLDLEQAFRTGPVAWNSRLKLRWGAADTDIILYEQGQNLYEFRDAAGTVVGNMTNTLFSDPRVRSFRVATRTRSTVQVEQEQGVANLDFVGNFDTGPAKHKLLLYAVYARSLSKELGSAGPFAGIDLQTYQRPSSIAAGILATPTRNIDTNIQTWSHALAAQDNVSFLDDRLIFVGGLRYDRSTADNVNRVANVRRFNDVRDAVSYKYGVVGRPHPAIGLYYNYSETFSPQGIDQVSGRVLPNLEPSTSEVGVKLNFFDDRLIVNGAYFDTITENALVAVTIVDAAGATRLTNVPAGRQTVKGWEVDATWSPIEGLDLMAGIGDLNSRTQTGVRARAVPLGLNYRVFGKYRLQSGGLLKGVFVGGGYENTPERALDFADTATLPGYDTFELFLGRRWKQWGVQVNVTNLFDKEAAWIAVARQIIYPLDPRRVRISASYTW